MTSGTTEHFWRCYAKLPSAIRKQAREAYKIFMQDPYHPGLHFKHVHSRRPIFSVRVTREYRAVGILKDGEMTWFWIGSHAQYERLIKQLRNIG